MDMGRAGQDEILQSSGLSVSHTSLLPNLPAQGHQVSIKSRLTRHVRAYQHGSKTDFFLFLVFLLFHGVGVRWAVWGPHPAVLRVSSWLYAQASLLVEHMELYLVLDLPWDQSHARQESYWLYYISSSPQTILYILFRNHTW